jgi:hypothetical protein
LHYTANYCKKPIEIQWIYIQEQDNDVMTVCPIPTYCKLHSLDSEAAFQLTVYVYHKKRLSSPKRTQCSTKQYGRLIIMINHHIIYGSVSYMIRWMVGPIAIMYDTMIGWANSYHIWYDDWLGHSRTRQWRNDSMPHLHIL